MHAHRPSLSLRVGDSRSVTNSVGRTCAVAALGILTAGCGDEAPLKVVNVETPIVTVSPATPTIAVGDSVRLLIAISPSYAPDSMAVCSSSATAVATAKMVNRQCAVFGVAPGTATVQVVSQSGVSAAAAVTVVGR
jgi:hypothetical protein